MRWMTASASSRRWLTTSQRGDSGRMNSPTAAQRQHDYGPAGTEGQVVAHLCSAAMALHCPACFGPPTGMQGDTWMHGTDQGGGAPTAGGSKKPKTCQDVLNCIVPTLD